MRIAKEGWPFIAGAAVAGLLAAGVALAAGWRAVAVAGAVAAGSGAAAMAAFFRDPERLPPVDDDVVLSGADGRVMEVAEAAEPEYFDEPCVRISVFLSIFNVHINRAPIAGRVLSLRHEPGRFRFAFDPQASRVNERNSILIEGPALRCLVRQIVGPVARRVVHWLEVGQTVRAGDRIGLMKFGSRLDVYLPSAKVELCVRVGMIVRAGETIVARLRNPTK